MKKRISITELSAYLDGEAKNPEKVKRQIQQSHEVARQHAELAEVAARVRALPEPELRPGFAGRVIASLSDQVVQPRLRWRLPATLSAVTAAILFLFAVLTGLNDGVSPSAPLETAVSAPEDEAAILAELQRQIAASPESHELLAGSFYEASELVEDLPESLLVALAPSDWLETFSGPAATHDYRVEMASLNEGEKDIFVQLLEEHARDEIQGQAADEG